jgi:cytochrome c
MRALGLLAAMVLGLSAFAAGADEPTSPSGYFLPFSSAQQGRDLFVNKGCVVCHAVNGVGGEIAPALDADPTQVQIDAFDFTARMWRGAQAMIAFQNMEFGFQIDLSGEDLADIARFLHDREAQRTFSEEEIPKNIRQMMRADALKELDL